MFAQTACIRLLKFFGAFHLVFVSNLASQVHDSSGPLIPREDLFGDPEKADARISPDGERLAWLAPADGVFNVWVSPVGDISAAAPVTQNKKRSIRGYAWAFDGTHLVYMQDKGGDENWHIYATDVEKRTTRDLTPFPGTRAGLVARSRKIRGEILIALNKRDPRYPDLFRVNLTTGELTLVAENPGFAAFVTDDEFNVRLVRKNTADAGAEILRREGDGWQSSLLIPPEDASTTVALHLDSAGKTLFMLDLRERDTAALMRIDLATGRTGCLPETLGPISDPREAAGTFRGGP